MLIGPDLSHWNTNIPYDIFGDFQIHKITQGNSWVDPLFSKWWENRVNSKCRCNGIYHYLEPSGKYTGEQQAAHLITTMKRYNVERVLVCYDYEGDAQAIDPQGTTLVHMIEAVFRALEHQPIVYTNKSGLKSFLQGKHGDWFKSHVSWWIADWDRKELFKPYEGIHAVMRQFTSKPLCDLNIFNGTEAGWLALCSEWEKN